MKQSVIILLVLVLFNCSSREEKPVIENENLLGKWKMIEQLADPGDGSGTFNPIDSNRIIQFFSDGTVIINGNLCYMSTDVGAEMSGIYEVIADDTADTINNGFIFPNDCDFAETKIYFYLPLNGNLILWYTCIEGCAQKFKKI
jgi:hypothetical protein